jgi:uncharacterized repeat protein (TIGR01451 family)
MLKASEYWRLRCFNILFLISSVVSICQVTPNINSGNPNFPFPQFLDYGPNRKTLASENPPGVTHAEMEQRMREAWRLICNNTSPYPGVVVSGVQYLYPTAPNHCTCAEGDGYYLLAAAIMADKPFFDGYYMWAHDRSFNGVKRFIDGVYNPYGNYSRGLSYAGSFGAGTGVYGGGISGNSAADGDVDIALALLIAYKQWGERSGIILNHGGWNGKEINYKEEALNYIKAMVDTSKFSPALPVIRYITGIIGLDGYMKRGDSWGELTPWALGGYKGMIPQTGSSNAHYIDYNAPAWFKQFAIFLQNEGERSFLIDQYLRAEASSDWLMGLHHSKDPRNIPYMGRVSYVSNTDFTFSNYIPDGEDFRAPWRTVMNYVWHGNPNYTWNPVTHEINYNTPNTYEYDVGVRYARFLKNQQGSPWNNPCRNIGDLASRPLTFKGPYTLVNGYTPNGGVLGAFPLNWIHGTGAASAIAAQDFELMGDMFRHCVIAWDAASGINLDSRPIYFHEFFRLLGMLTLTGNFHAPDKMVPRPNLKVYHKVDKTVAYVGDLVTFTVTYRNYGSVDGINTVVKFKVPSDFQFVSSNKGTLVGDSVVWNVGTAKGFKTGGLNATIDSMKVILRIGPTANGRYCTAARVTVSNGTGWVSNEYPNNITAVMERNCVDVTKRPLKIEKTANRNKVNPNENGNVIFKIKFENSSEVGWLNGGRPGVRLAFAYEPMTNPTATAANVLKFRLFHDAAEPYIDYGNYRVSYFMNDNNIKCYVSQPGCNPGWTLQNTIAEGVVPANVTITHENIVPGSDANGSWNQRIVLQFSKQLATITQHLQQYAGTPSMIHEGGTALLRGVWRLFPSNYANVNWTDDWSWSGSAFADGDGGLYFPIGDDYTDPNNLGIPINSWHKSACQTTNTIMKKILVEEWDGYVWRRVFGNGPVPGRDVYNVVIRDTLPVGMTFLNFIRQNPLGIQATATTIAGGRTVIAWSAPKLMINEKDSIVFTVNVTPPCAEKDIINRAWISSSSESPIYDDEKITVTCNPVTICPLPTSLSKTSNKSTYSVGEIITYTLNYTQTQGSISNPSLNTSVDWTINGNGASFGPNRLVLNGGNASTARVIVTYDYALGTNTLGDGIEGTIQIQPSENDFAIVVRDDIYIRLSSSGGTNPTFVDIYSGNTRLNSTSFSVPFFASSFDFRIKLNGDVLSMWLVASGTPISGPAPIIQTGVPVKQGRVGFAHGIFANNPYATHYVTAFKAHMDVAFNVQIVDPIPLGIASPTNISSPGILSGSTITWNIANGKSNPLAYGATRTLSWQGVYNLCQDITNVAYVNTMGTGNNVYGVCYETKCLGATPVNIKSWFVSIENNINKLQWSTVNETDILCYFIQKSNNLKDWQTIGFVRPVNNPLLVNYYSFDDLQPQEQNYYRLLIKENNESQFLSEIVYIETKQKNVIKIYPNPFESEFYLELKNIDSDPIHLIMNDLYGKVVFEDIINGVEGSQIVYPIKPKIFASGNYVVIVKTPKQYVHFKIQKH